MKINIYFCLAVACVLAGCVAILLYFYSKLNQQYRILRENYVRIEGLNTELRAQRHDYLNQLQVVYGLMELKEYEELKRYLTPVFKDMLKTGKALKTSKPAINALLKAKMDEAEGKQIDFYAEIKSDLKELKMEDWELCRVLANLIDNAMTALEGFEASETLESGENAASKGQADTFERYIRLEITEDRDNYLFSVANNGPRIPENVQSMIFKKGYTTKREAGHGMGLAIVTNVLNAHHGSIELHSEAETVFTFRIPK